MKIKQYKMNITEELITKLDSKRLNLSHWFILEEIKEEKQISDSIKNSSVWQTLARKSYIADNKITEIGQELIDSIQDRPVKIKKSKKTILNASQQFDEWWELYPSTDRVMEGDSTFYNETRALRQAKSKCKEKYIEILNQGTYSHEELIAALKYEINMRKDQSLKGSDNKLTFMKGSLTYLNQGAYEAFIDIAKVKVKENKPSTFII